MTRRIMSELGHVLSFSAPRSIRRWILTLVEFLQKLFDDMLILDRNAADVEAARRQATHIRPQGSVGRCVKAVVQLDGVSREQAS